MLSLFKYICTHRKHTVLVCVHVISLHKWHQAYVLFFNLLFSLNHIVWRSFHKKFWSMSIFSFNRLPKSHPKGLYNLHLHQKHTREPISSQPYPLGIFKSYSFFVVVLLILLILFPVIWNFLSFGCLSAWCYCSQNVTVKKKIQWLNIEWTMIWSLPPHIPASPPDFRHSSAALFSQLPAS